MNGLSSCFYVIQNELVIVCNGRVINITSYIYKTTNSMAHDYNTRAKNVLSQQDILTKLEENIINSINNNINGLRDEILNLKDIVIKRLQEENEKLHNKCNKLAGKVVSLEKEINSLNQYGRRKNIVFRGIPDDELEETVTSILSDIDVKINLYDIVDCHRFGKQDFKTKSKKTIVTLVNRRYCKKALLNRKKLSNLDNMKYNFRNSSKIFINENLTRVNENIAFQGRKLKRKGMVNACCTRNGVIHIKKSERSKPIKSGI